MPDISLFGPLCEILNISIIELLKAYNGTTGNNKFMKWFFYIYYPPHLVIIGILRLIIHGNISLLF